MEGKRKKIWTVYEFIRKHQPVYPKEIIKDTQIKPRTVYACLSKLREEEKTIKQLPDKRYVLIDYEPIEGVIKEFLIKERRTKYFNFRWSSKKEISLGIGKPWGEIEKFVYKLAPEIGWEPPTSEDIKYTKICQRILRTYLNTKYLALNLSYKDGYGIIDESLIPHIITSMGGKFLQKRKENRVILPLLPFDAKVKVEKVQDSRMNKEDFEEIKKRLPWISVQSVINSTLPTIDEKRKFANWLKEKSFYAEELEFRLPTKKRGNYIKKIDRAFWNVVINILHRTQPLKLFL